MPFEAARAVDAAANLGLAERIGARIPGSLLDDDLGRESARRLAFLRLHGLVSARALCALLPELAGALVAARVPVALLKFAGLHAAGCLLPDSRSAGDLDLLIPEQDGQRAVEILGSHGFSAAPAGLSDHHHLPPLRDRQGRLVEVHTRLPGLRPPGRRRFAGFAALEAAGALRAAPGWPAGCHVLAPDFMAAHAVAHGLAQHGGADPYPLARLLADVIDVLPAGRLARGLAARDWLASDVPAERVEALLGLCDALAAGDLDGLDARPVQAALLAHVVATALDPDYRRALAVASLWRSLSDEPRWWRALKTAQALALPSRSQLAARYGLPGPRHVNARLWLAHARGLTLRLPGLARVFARVVSRRTTRT